MRKTLILLASLMSASLGASRAHASGFEMARFGSDRAHAAAPTAFATYYNPAALGATRKVQLAGDFMLALHSASYDRTATTIPEPADAEGANLGKAKVMDVVAGPAVAGSFKLGDFAGGFGVFAPFAGGQRWQGNDAFRGNTSYPGAQDGTARWHLIDGSMQSIYFSASAAYTIRPWRLSLGAGANLIYSTVAATRAYTLSLDDNLANEGRIHIDFAGLTGSFSVGALWEILADELWLGVSYQAPPGLYDGMTLKGKVRTVRVGDPTETRASLRQALPDIIRFALRYKQERYELRLSGDYTRWSVFKNQCASQRGTACEVSTDGAATPDVLPNIISAYPRNWQDAFGIKVGGSYWFSPAWEIFTTLGFDGNAIPAGMLEPSVIDGKDLSAQLGGRYNIGSRVALSLAYTAIYYLPRDTSGLSRLDKLQQPGNLPTGDGKYTQFIGLFNTFVEVYFD